MADAAWAVASALIVGITLLWVSLPSAREPPGIQQHLHNVYTMPILLFSSGRMNYGTEDHTGHTDHTYQDGWKERLFNVNNTRSTYRQHNARKTKQNKTRQNNTTTLNEN